jgi:uncharacterized protein YbdZ (MbtH family)
MTSPFDDDGGHFLVFVHAENRHAPRSDFAAIPAEWRARCESEKRPDCLASGEKTWADMRPGKVIAAMEVSVA